MPITPLPRWLKLLPYTPVPKVPAGLLFVPKTPGMNELPPPSFVVPLTPKPPPALLPVTPLPVALLDTPSTPFVAPLPLTPGPALETPWTPAVPPAP